MQIFPRIQRWLRIALNSCSWDNHSSVEKKLHRHSTKEVESWREKCRGKDHSGGEGSRFPWESGWCGLCSSKWRGWFECGDHRSKGWWGRKDEPCSGQWWVFEFLWHRHQMCEGRFGSFLEALIIGLRRLDFYSVALNFSDLFLWW